MDKAKKYAYRYLIYHGALCIRPVASIGLRWWERWNLMYWFRELDSIRIAGGTADWLHNLALFSAIDFEGFDESSFWARLECLRGTFPEKGLESFRSIFLHAIFEFNEGRWPTQEEQSMLLEQHEKIKKA